jgi:HlyD family secretion protein
MPRKANLSFGITGLVAEILVDEGESVVKGQTLARLDARSLELNVEMAQAEYEMAEYKLMQTIYPKYGSTYRTDLPGVWLALEEAQDSLAQAQNLLSEGGLEEAQALLKQVEADLHKAQEKSQARRWPLPLWVKLVEMEADQARTALDIAIEDLAKATIIAPFDGIVTDIDMKTGERISAAAGVVSLVDPTNIEMDGAIDEIDISRVVLGQETIVTLDALPDKEVRGKITFISEAGMVQAGVVSYKATVTLENHDEKLRDGMSATAEIIIERHESVLLIPNRAIQGTWDKPLVEVVGGEQTERREVILGLSDGIDTEVLSGLEAGEIVVFPESQLPFRMFGG